MRVIEGTTSRKKSRPGRRGVQSSDLFQRTRAVQVHDVSGDEGVAVRRARAVPQKGVAVRGKTREDG